MTHAALLTKERLRSITERTKIRTEYYSRGKMEPMASAINDDCAALLDHAAALQSELTNARRTAFLDAAKAIDGDTVIDRDAHPEFKAGYAMGATHHAKYLRKIAPPSPETERE